MLYPTGAQIPFVALFTNSKAGATGLTVTVSVVRLNSDGTRTTVITQASNTAATELDSTNAKGLYGYLLAGASTGTAGAYLATFHTAGTVDQADVPALEIVGPAWVQNSSSFVDVAISSRNAVAPDNTSIASILAKTDVATSTRLAASSYTSPLTAGQVENAVWDAVATSHNTAGSTGAKLNSAAAAGDPLTNSVPGNYAVGTAGYKLGLIGTTTYTVVSPIASSGTITLVSGSAYKHSIGTHIPWSYNNPLNLDITGSTSTFTLVSATPSSTGTVTITTFSGLTLGGYFEFTAAQTAALSAGSYTYEHVITFPSADPVVVARGLLVVE